MTRCLPFRHDWRTWSVAPVAKRKLRVRICDRCGRAKTIGRAAQ